MSFCPPNILWIVATQWRAQACGYAGDPNARTPHLDALAAESVNYTQAVTPHPFGPFARAALLTGVPSPENGVRDYFDFLPPDSRTIAHELRERGYLTAFFGKWGVGRRDPALPLVGEAAAKVPIPPGERGGFEVFEGFEGGFQLNDPWLWVADPALTGPMRMPGYQSRVVVDRFLGWRARAGMTNDELRMTKGGMVGRSGGRTPWFAVVSLEAPHPPYDAPADGVARPEPTRLQLPPNVPRGGEAEARARRELSGYYAHIEATDRALGRLLAAEALRHNTVVVFTSVHGDMHGAHGLFRKGWPHEESIRVPLLIRGAGRPGREDRPISLLDLLPLAREWAAGRSDVSDNKLQLAQGEDQPPGRAISMPAVVALPHQCDRVWRGVRTTERKLILGPDGEPWLYFDLAHDPQETRNLAGDPARATEIAALHRLMRERG